MQWQTIAQGEQAGHAWVGQGARRGQAGGIEFGVIAGEPDIVTQELQGIAAIFDLPVGTLDFSPGAAIADKNSGETGQNDQTEGNGYHHLNDGEAVWMSLVADVHSRRVQKFKLRCHISNAIGQSYRNLRRNGAAGSVLRTQALATGQGWCSGRVHALPHHSDLVNAGCANARAWVRGLHLPDAAASSLHGSGIVSTHFFAGTFQGVAPFTNVPIGLGGDGGTAVSY